MRIHIYFLILITFDYKERKTRWDFENDHNSFKMVREEVETHIKVLSVTETLLAHIVHRTSIGYPTVHFPFFRLALATDILWMVYFDPDNGWSRMVILGCPMNVHLVPISDVKSAVHS